MKILSVLLLNLLAFSPIFADALAEANEKKANSAIATSKARIERALIEKEKVIKQSEKKRDASLAREDEKLELNASDYDSRRTLKEDKAHQSRKAKEIEKRKENIIRLSEKEINDVNKKFENLVKTEKKNLTKTLEEISKE